MKPFKDWLKIYGSALVVSLAGFWLAYQFVDPAPPASLTIGTGHPSGAYYLFAQRYRDILAQDHITVNIRTTAGSQENLRLLESPAPKSMSPLSKVVLDRRRRQASSWR